VVKLRREVLRKVERVVWTGFGGLSLLDVGNQLRLMLFTNGLQVELAYSVGLRVGSAHCWRLAA